VVNGLRICERLASADRRGNASRPGKTRYRYFLGVKWSQVQILSARPEFLQFRGSFGEIRYRLFSAEMGLDSTAKS